MEWFVHGGVTETGQGCWQMCRCVSMTLLHMCKGLSHKSVEADDSDVT